MIQQKNQVQTLFEMWEILLRFRWRFIFPALVAMSMVLGLCYLLPRKYKAKAIFERRTDLVMMEMMHRGASSAMPAPKKAMIEEIAGQPAIDALLEMVPHTPWAKRHGPMPTHQIEQLRSELNRRILVNHDIADKQLDRVSVEYVDEDADLAKTVVNQLVQNYIDRTRSQIERRLEQTATFFEAEVRRSRDLIETLENQQLAFEIEHAELLPDKPGSIQAMLIEAQLQQIALKQQRDATETRLATLRQQIDAMPESIPKVTHARNAERDRLDAKRQALQDKLETFLNQYKMTSRHPDLAVLQAEIATIDREISKTPELVVAHTQISANAKREQLEVQLADAATQLRALEKQEESLATQIDQLNRETADLFPVRSEYRKLTRQTEEAQRQVHFWEGNLRRVQMALTAEAGNRGIQLAFIKPAKSSSRPVSPSLAQALAAALIIGLLAGGVNVLIAHRTDDSFSDAVQVAEAFNLTLYGSVSEIISRQQTRVRRIQNLVLYPLNTVVALAVLCAMAGLLYINLENPQMIDRFRNQQPAALGPVHQASSNTPLGVDRE